MLGIEKYIPRVKIIISREIKSISDCMNICKWLYYRQKCIRFSFCAEDFVASFYYLRF